MPGMQPTDVHRLTGVADPRVSPDGTTVAHVVWWIDAQQNEYRSALWLAPVDGGAPPRRITFGAGKDAAPRWSPDGRWLAFTSNRAGDLAQLYVMPAAGPGEPRRLTDHKESVSQVTWSPDGSHLAFSARVPDEAYEEKDDAKRRPRRIARLWYKLDDEGWTIDRPHHLFVVPADGSAPARQLTSGDFEDTEPAWSPDGSTIAFTSARHQDWDITTVNDIYAVPVDGGEPSRLTVTDGSVSHPSWSPDGTRIAFGFTPGEFDEPRHAQIAILDLASGTRTLLTETLDRNCVPYPPFREPVWDGETIVFALEDGGRVLLYRVRADGSVTPAPIAEGPWCVTGYDATAGVVAEARTDATSLAQLWVDGERRTDVGRALLDDVAAVAPERFTATAPDGTEVDAWIMRPRGLAPGARAPLVLHVHGGPFTQYGDRFFDEFQVQAAAGYAVVYANPRGSSGYTEDWGRAIRGPIGGGPGWGSVDFEDLMAVVDEAIRRFDFVDAARLGVMGGSYGGYMTSWIVGHTDRFACAISERAVNDMASEDGTCDFAGFFRASVGGAAWEDVEAYLRVSPWTYAKDVTTPLLILHSEDDLRCPVGQAEELFTVLRSLRKPVEMVRFPAEGHEMSRSGSPAHRVMRFEVVLEWLDRHLHP